MKRNRKGLSGRRRAIPLWTHAQALNMVPYMSSVMRSIRDHALELQRHQLSLRRLASRPGKPDRSALIAQEEENRASQLALTHFTEALNELERLGIFCIHPIRGEALVPFAIKKQLAWFVFDLFDESPLLFWRFHNDPLETRRPLAEVEEAIDDNSRLV